MAEVGSVRDEGEDMIEVASYNIFAPRSHATQLFHAWRVQIMVLKCSVWKLAGGARSLLLLGLMRG